MVRSPSRRHPMKLNRNTPIEDSGFSFTSAIRRTDHAFFFARLFLFLTGKTRFRKLLNQHPRLRHNHRTKHAKNEHHGQYPRDGNRLCRKQNAHAFRLATRNLEMIYSRTMRANVSRQNCRRHLQVMPECLGWFIGTMSKSSNCDEKIDWIYIRFSENFAARWPVSRSGCGSARVPPAAERSPGVLEVLEGVRTHGHCLSFARSCSTETKFFAFVALAPKPGLPQSL